MSTDEYYVEPDGDGDPTLWESDRPIISLIGGDNLFVRPSKPRHQVAAWTAAVSVLAPDDETVEALAEKLHAAHPEHHAYADCEVKEKFRIEAQAALAALRDRAVTS